MTAIGWIQIVVFFAAIVAVTKPLGVYMFRVFEGERQPFPRVLGRFERLLYRLSGVDPEKEQNWKEYTFALLVFSALRPARHLPDPADCSTSCRSTRSTSPAVEHDARLQHRRQLHDQHQLAGRTRASRR